MKLTKSLCTLATGALLSLTTFAADEAGFKPLFDGKTLNGWEGRKEHWTVEDGAITECRSKRSHLLAKEEPLFVIQPRHTPAYG